MPVTKSAKKKLRHDIKIEKENNKLRRQISSAVKKARKNPDLKAFASVSKIVDKAAKKNIIHKNKAARIKSKLSKLVKTPPSGRTKKPSK